MIALYRTSPDLLVALIFIGVCLLTGLIFGDSIDRRWIEAGFIFALAMAGGKSGSEQAP